MFFPLNNQLTFFRPEIIYGVQSQSPFFKGPLRYGYFTLCLLRYEYLHYAFLRYAFLRHASLRYSSLRYGYLLYGCLRYVFLRYGHLQNRLVAIQLWIDTVMIWTILFYFIYDHCSQGET